MGRCLKKRRRKQVNDKLCYKRPKTVHNYIDNLPDELLVTILSFLPLKEAAMTSILSLRWRYLWHFTSGTLDFDYTSTGMPMKRKKFISWVNCVLKLHQGSQVDAMSIRFRHKRAQSYDIDSWIDFVAQKKVKKFELKLSEGSYSKYTFPDLNKLSNQIPCVFFSLRDLRLVNVQVKDEVVHYFLASCPFLEQLCLNGSLSTENLKVVEPSPSFKRLEVSDCYRMQSLEISVSTLVSLKYIGLAIGLHFKKVPNLSELILGGPYGEDFILEPKKHDNYLASLEKLVLRLDTRFFSREIRPSPDFPRLCSLKHLELEIYTNPSRGLLFFISLMIKSCPLLHRVKFEIVMLLNDDEDLIVFPDVKAVETNGCYLKHLKVVEMTGNCVGRSSRNLLLHLVSIAPSLELIVMDPQIYIPDDDELRARGMKYDRERANKIRRKLPPQIQLTVL